MNPNEIPRKKQDGMVQLSMIYLFGTEKIKWDMSEEELEEYINNEGIRTLPDMSVAVDPVMTVEQCREIFRTGKYPEGLGESLGFTMRE